MMGPWATDEQLDLTRSAVLENPRGWIAQPVVTFSTCPTVVEDGRIAPRHVDLRPFAVNDGTNVFVLPGGLSRVALPEGSLVVNSSQGGGSKDTWVIDDGTLDDAPAGVGVAGALRALAVRRRRRQLLQALQLPHQPRGPAGAAAASAAAVPSADPDRQSTRRHAEPHRRVLLLAGALRRAGRGHRAPAVRAPSAARRGPLRPGGPRAARSCSTRSRCPRPASRPHRTSSASWWAASSSRRRSPAPSLPPAPTRAPCATPCPRTRSRRSTRPTWRSPGAWPSRRARASPCIGCSSACSWSTASSTGRCRATRPTSSWCWAVSSSASTWSVGSCRSATTRCGPRRGRPPPCAQREPSRRTCAPASPSTPPTCGGSSCSTPPSPARCAPARPTRRRRSAACSGSA